MNALSLIFSGKPEKEVEKGFMCMVYGSWEEMLQYFVLLMSYMVYNIARTV